VRLALDHASTSCRCPAAHGYLTLAVAAINAWNRLNIAGRTVPGAYRKHDRPGPTVAGPGQSRHDLKNTPLRSRPITAPTTAVAGSDVN
jgi:hypothetical protein